MTRIANFPSKKKYQVNRNIQRFFTLVHISLSLDFGYVYFSSRKKRFLVKILTFVQCVIIAGVSSIYYSENNHDPFILAWMSMASTEYFINSVVILLCDRKNSYYMLQKRLTSIDVKLSVETESFGLDKKLILASVGSIIVKIFLNFSFCIDHDDECLTSTSGTILHVLMLLSYEMLLITSSFVFYSVYCRLKVFNEHVKNTKQILQSMDMFKIMADAVERPKRYFDYLYILALLLKTPELILTTYLGLLKAKDIGGVELTHHQVIRYLYMLHNFAMLCCPAVCAGAVSTAVARLKLILQDRMLVETDESREALIQRFSEYVEARPMRFFVFKVIPLDWRLPIILLNLCISYQIVIVQFTKLY